MMPVEEVVHAKLEQAFHSRNPRTLQLAMMDPPGSADVDALAWEVLRAMPDDDCDLSHDGSDVLDLAMERLCRCSS